MSKTIIIAEAGVNHNGSLELALRLVDAAADAGADAVKFQTFQADKLVSLYAPKAEYQKKNTDQHESQLAMMRKLELSYEDHLVLLQRCRERNILFLSTPFDSDSIEFLSGLGMRWFKIPSGELTDFPYLRQVNAKGGDIILSTGMATLDEIAAALKVLDNCHVTLLHCTTEYPCPPEDVNLRAMQTMKNAFGLPVGYSDHTRGIDIPIAAVALGAVIIEKHFTLSRGMEGPDHKASLEPHELKLMVDGIRSVENALGSGQKLPAPSEQKNINVARRSIVAARPIHKGELFSEENITTKRPGSGISPMRWNEVLGTPAQRDYAEDEII